MKEQGFLSRFPNQKGISKNSYQILDEVSKLLGLSGEEMPLLFKLLRKSDYGLLRFRCGDMWIHLDRNPDCTEGSNLIVTLAFEKDQAEKLFHYCYDLRQLEALLRHKHDDGIQGE